MKRLTDLSVSLFGLILGSPILLLTLVAIWLQDFRSPFYIAPRVGRVGRSFLMVKLRSMVVGADKSGVDSTSADDRRITFVGHWIRRFKLDEVTQFWNVLKGDMSLVGPSPNVEQDVALYTEEEKGLLAIRPGITDLASIVFADEGDILEGSEDPDLLYNQIIRPWKSRLGLLYVERNSFFLDLRIIFLTALNMVSRSAALRGVGRILRNLGVDGLLLETASRKEELMPYPPPGSSEVARIR